MPYLVSDAIIRIMCYDSGINEKHILQKLDDSFRAVIPKDSFDIWIPYNIMDKGFRKSDFSLRTTINKYRQVFILNISANTRYAYPNDEDIYIDVIKHFMKKFRNNKKYTLESVLCSIGDGDSFFSSYSYCNGEKDLDVRK